MNQQPARVEKWKNDKYILMRRAGSILFDRALSAQMQHRTCWCHRGVVNASDSVSVYRQATGESARLHGVTTCKSVWACPVCSARICAQRQVELSRAVVEWTRRGSYCAWPRENSDKIRSTNYVWLLTHTFPHERGMPLADTLKRFIDARTHFKNSRVYKSILGKGVRKGTVSALEVTFGDEHGWHPHQHDLVFATADAFGEVKEIDKSMHSWAIDELKAQWFASLLKVGLCVPSDRTKVLEHGLDVRGGQYAAEYAAKFGMEQKWGLSREVAMNVCKTGMKVDREYHGAHPFQLLAWAENGDGEAAAQFREYAEAFDGKRMLTWSRNLKKELLGTEDEDDATLPDDPLPEEQHVGRITSESLSILHSRRLLGEFLTYVAVHCIDLDSSQEYIDEYFKAIAEHVPRTARGDVKVKMWTRAKSGSSLGSSDGFMYVDREKELEPA
jgi:hypothetical protein